MQAERVIRAAGVIRTATLVLRLEASGSRWERHVVSSRGSHNIELADLYGDGHLDIMGANHGGTYQPVELSRNRRGNPAGK